MPKFVTRGARREKIRVNDSPQAQSLKLLSQDTNESADEHAPVLVQNPSAPTETQMRAGESVPRFAALRHRNFRIFWMGNLVSLVGTLAQQTAQSWLMRELTPNELIITAVAAAGSAPILIFTLYAGVIADRVDKRRTLLVTNGLSALLALVLAALVYWKLIQIWHIAVISFAVGVVNAFDIPTRQSFNVEMVGREDLPNAIALNSSAFNGARVAGPMVGGFLLQLVGMAGCFLVNAFSFLALILGLWRMDIEHVVKKQAPARLSDIREGFDFVRRHPTLRQVTILVAWVSLFAMWFGPLLPVFAKDVFETDARGFSFLATCNGLGALGSAVSLAVAGKMRHRGKRLLLGAALFSLSVIAFAASPGLPQACFFLILAGWFLLTFLMTANTLVQTIAPDELRGRVFSVYSLALIGTSPIAALQVGAMSRVVGPRLAVQFGGAISAAFVLYVFLRYRELWKEK
ncbi:MAG TPA: MFS transporter [Abditibacteriaceae bacterium]|jgi:MFS family permease